MGCSGWELPRWSAPNAARMGELRAVLYWVLFRCRWRASTPVNLLYVHTHCHLQQNVVTLMQPGYPPISVALGVYQRHESHSQKDVHEGFR